MFKRIGIFSLILFMATLLLVGCNGSSSTGGSNDTSNNKETNDTNDGSSLEELTYFVELDPKATTVMQDYNSIAAYKELEKLTGVKVKFEHPPAGEEGDQQFSLMMASNELPDVIEYNWSRVPGGAEAYLESGQIVKLNDYLEEYAPNLTKVLDEYPEYRKQISTDDGSIYGFPFLRGVEQDGNKENLTFRGPIMRKDWLDNLGLDVPTTIDEWYTVLKAFKTEDPNGNGEDDELPHHLEIQSNVFLSAWGLTFDFYQVDGEVKYGPYEPEYKEYLETMNKWYEEGLIDPEYVVTDGDLLDANITTSKTGSWYGFVAGGMGKYLDLMNDDPDFELVGAPYPTLNKGDLPAAGHQTTEFEGIAATITKDNEHIEETVKWLDQGYSEEGHMLFNWGVEGESYEMVDGEPLFTELITDNPEGLPFQEAEALYTRAGWFGPFVTDPLHQKQLFHHAEQEEAVAAWAAAENDILMPFITHTPEESDEIAELLSDIYAHKNTLSHQFINGDESLDNFDQYLETLKDLGIEQVIEIKQAALDRYEQR